jgi:hypothetical protein
MTEKTWTVYKLTDSRTPSDIRYVGITSGTLTRRLAQHKGASGNNYRTNWIRSVLRAGADVVICPLVTDLSESQAKAMEVELIAKYRSLGSRLVNSTDGGDGNVGWNPSNETRKRMAASASKAMTLEHRVRLSLIQKSLVTPEVRERIGASHRGKTMSGESRTRIASAMTVVSLMRPPRNGGFKGVHKMGSKWQSAIRTSGKSSHLGTFSTPEEAAHAYDAAAYAAWGDKCYLNFGAPRAIAA